MGRGQKGGCPTSRAFREVGRLLGAGPAFRRHNPTVAAPSFAVFAKGGRQCRRHNKLRLSRRVRPKRNLSPTLILSRRSRLAECAIRSFKNGENAIRPRSLRKLTRAIHNLQNKTMKK